jgi:uncharacterized RDD family membrane protein YckC
MAYEAVLLFGIVFIAGWLFDTLTQSRHALMLRHARQFWLFAVLGAYFIFFWTHGGQTLAMKTWRIRLAAAGKPKVPFHRALARYLLAWMWFLPAMAIDFTFGLKGWTSVATVLAGMLMWAFASKIGRSGQFLHDRLAGTQLITSTTTEPVKADSARDIA